MLWSAAAECLPALFLQAPYRLCAEQRHILELLVECTDICRLLFLVQRHFIIFNHPSEIVATQPQSLIVMAGIQLSAIISINCVADGELPH